MDDIMLLGRSKRDLSIAARRITAFARDRLRLDMHPEWNIKHVGIEPIDMVGYTFRPGRTNIRTGIFLRAGRTFARFRRHPRNLTLARRCASYYGYFIHSDSTLVRRRRQVDETMRMAKRTLSCANQQQRKDKR